LKGKQLRFIYLAVPLVLAGCAGAIATNSQSKSAASGIATLRSIEQAAAIGAYGSARSFDIVAPKYVSALNAFRAARPSEAADGEARAEEQNSLRQAFDNCIEAVELQAEIHRTSGLSDDPSDFLAKEVCQSAADALERSK
jgi:hypothetical protein